MQEHKTRRGKTALRAALLLGAVTLVFMLGRWFVQGALYPAPTIPVPEQPPDGYISVSFSCGSANSSAWFRSGNPDAMTLLYFHGNAENLETMRQYGPLASLELLDLSLLVVDYPGYGRSTGKASEENILRCADSAANWLATSFPNSKKIVAGWSLGAAVAVQTAARHSDLFDGLIIMSAWNSLFDASIAHFPRWMMKLLQFEKYDSEEAASRVQCPVLQIHGAQDTLIPQTLGEILSRNFRKVRWISIPEVGHNDLLLHPQVWQEVKNFINAREHRDF